jgi:flagellin FlaB
VSDLVNKKAEAGIGTLIIFIAMILVAAIAASVLIQTATSLQNKALLTGTRAEDQISTSMQVVSVYAEDGSSGDNLKEFYAKLKLAPGSDPVKLNGTLVVFDTESNTTNLQYDSGITCATGSSSYTNGKFGVRSLVLGTSTPQYLNRGDVVEICFSSPENVSTNKAFTLTLIPQVGTQTVVESVTPDVINDKREYLFP